MNKKGFTIMELIITVAIMGVVALIAVPSFVGIKESSTINADKITASQIGKALKVARIEMESFDLSGTPKPYQSINNIEEYISKDYKPNSLQDGYYIATQVKVKGIKVLMVGITKNDENGAQIEIGKTVVYDGKQPGWAWVESGDIEKFLKENSDIEIGTGTGGGTSGEETPQECNHSYTSEITTTATCTTNGVRTYTCINCGYSYTNTESATGHNYSNGTCTNCGKSECDHDYTITTLKEATCAEYGTQQWECNLCDDNFTVNLPMKSHELTTTVATEATCTETGEKITQCSNCSYSYTTVIEAKGHIKYGVSVDDTYHKNGCTRCGLIDSDELIYHFFWDGSCNCGEDAKKTYGTITGIVKDRVLTIEWDFSQCDEISLGIGEDYYTDMLDTTEKTGILTSQTVANYIDVDIVLQYKKDGCNYAWDSGGRFNAVEKTFSF